MYRERDGWPAIAVTTWETRKANDITPAKPWNCWNVLKEILSKSVRMLKERLENSGIRLINERFAARRLAFEIDYTLNVTTVG